MAQPAPDVDKSHNDADAVVLLTDDGRPMERQEHGGALARGGAKARPGSDRSAIRAMLRGSIAQKWPQMLERWDVMEPADQARLADIGFKYGLGTQSQALTPQAVEEQVKVLYDEIVGKLREMGFSDYSAWAWVSDLTKRTKIAYARQEGLDGGEEAAPEVKATIQSAIAPPDAPPEEP